MIAPGRKPLSGCTSSKYSFNATAMLTRKSVTKRTAHPMLIARSSVGMRAMSIRTGAGDPQIKIIVFPGQFGIGEAISKIQGNTAITKQVQPREKDPRVTRSRRAAAVRAACMSTLSL